MVSYYNEIDPYAAQWLRNLIADGHIAAGDIDTRSIVELSPDEIRGYTQCHFFAGIGGWSLALRLSGWPDDRPVWTGSCPCQPFSAAGKKGRQSDERHLWPHWGRPICECRPATVFGEQVDDAIASGWLDDAFYEMEEAAYACAAAVLPACSIGAPHERQRLWFVAHRANATATRRDTHGRRLSGLQKMEGDRFTSNTIGRQQRKEIARGNTCHGEMEKAITDSDEAGRENGQLESRLRASEISLNRCSFVEAWQGWNGGFSGFGRLDDGVSSRMAKSTVAGFGNAIVPQVAAEFIKAFMDVEKGG